MWSVSYFQIPLCGLLVLSSFLQEATSCPKGWLNYFGNCYGLFPEKITRKEAEEECQSLGQGGHLASIRTQTEMEAIIQYITTDFKGVGNVWIGLRDKWKLRRWVWEDGADVKDFYWTDGAPKFFTNSYYCAYMIESEGYKTWKDAKCSETNASLCKLKD